MYSLCDRDTGRCYGRSKSGDEEDAHATYGYVGRNCDQTGQRSNTGILHHNPAALNHVSLRAACALQPMANDARFKAEMKLSVDVIGYETTLLRIVQAISAEY